MEGEPTIAAKSKNSLAILNNEIVEAGYKSQHILLIVLEGDAKVYNGNGRSTYCEKNSQLEKKRGQAFSMIRGQCMRVILDKMKHDPDWDNKNESYDPLNLLKLIGKKILAQNEDPYFYTTVYNQEFALYWFNQHNLANEQYYERFNTKVDAGEAIGIKTQQRFLMEDTSQETLDFFWWTYFRLKNGSKKEYRGKVTFIYFSSTKWK